ncbi:hypothetical protein PUNSTDRAFT_66483 [Punctularia strigosozonata HHB-11173 SS5]|uniref:uncharacterized protein n=1 Tax=Punctularia strigosozonata (strain HHB-11173) TaxID=741275 RepID=UPI0004416891|nr:uncharacterized protein PUNSTDRAFT_66483 [Punctularia strigosozonata HHB-11173 SS5]EIN10041.1 hypothetical protein PUNSTDRAFT_66483 [Punctularia strigosozonata HHB-11173 SS5]
MTQVLATLKADHIDTTRYGLGMTKFKQLCTKWGIASAQKQGHTIETINASMQELLLKFPKAGTPTLQNLLRTDYGIRVSQEKVLTYLKTVHLEGVQERKKRKFKRKVFYAAGVNHIWVFDQHDKWSKFGLYLHVGVEPFSGKILWLVVWWTNSNPRYVTRQYLNTARRLGNIIPLISQSDPGSENNGIANAHTAIRQHLDPSLAGTLQHRWMRRHNNIKPEIEWSVLRSTWAPGFENLFEHGVNKGWYDPSHSLHYLVFRWLAIPFIQTELDGYVARRNTTLKRANPKKALPNGRPDMIFEKPERYNTVNFGINVPREVLDEAEAQWAPHDHPVFNLVPPYFATFVQEVYASLGPQPPLSYSTFWEVYLHLLEACMALVNSGSAGRSVNDLLSAQASAPASGEDQGIPLLENLTPVELGMHGVPKLVEAVEDRNPEEEEQGIFAEFSDEEDELV